MFIKDQVQEFYKTQEEYYYSEGYLASDYNYIDMAKDATINEFSKHQKSVVITWINELLPSGKRYLVN